MLNIEVVELAKARNAAPTVRAPMSDGWLSFCIDYRMWLEAAVQLYAVDIGWCLPILRKDEYPDSLGGALILYTLDAKPSLFTGGNLQRGSWQNSLCFASKAVQIVKSAI